ncbi:Dyggve-Melchior-Clausen syndrome protein-domain-containing protein [Mycotypha africana]|uniref:Dyggve-Melchior-Clausen syndrome protein-domain-containing protein n=1 Tax=Mycotypha africana TaxID=64632 RepID=UPI0023006EA9|nr:Dyggve-Melchior-Clausen syndrome protein-domain-containing protein [Mycotypha africana]KAI8967406.1 Dyggve-Melchior-Clausen syndrome protein-domain-containing protein [Mycotypha africana]
MNNSKNVSATPLTAPTRTLQAPEPTSSSSRRIVNFNKNTDNLHNNNSSSDVSVPVSPHLELSDSFAALSTSISSSATATTPTVKASPYYFNNKYTSQQQIQHSTNINSPTITENYSPFFSSNQLAKIKPICSTVNITDWSFLSTEKYPSSLNQQDAIDLEMSTIGLSIELAANNMKTRNLNRLMDHLLELFENLQRIQNQDIIIPIETYNALLLTRIFIKQFADNLCNQEIIEQIEDDTSRKRGEQLFKHLLYILTNMDPSSNYSTYEFYVEVLNTFFVLISTQLYQQHLFKMEGEEDNYFLNLLMTKFHNRAETIVARLFENFIAQHLPPPQPPAGALYTAYSYFFSSGRNSFHYQQNNSSPPVAERSLLLLLLLGNQPENDWTKSYRRAIANLNDHHVISSDMDSCDGGKMHLISFKNLLDIFLKSIHVEEKMLLFYLILVENESFRVYVLSRTDQEHIYLPILKLIYESMEGTSKFSFSQVYILLTILLMFSQDDMNNDAIQKITVQNIAWFTERPLLKSISLGGLMILVLLRIVQLNLSQKKDAFLHTNCLAILLNMSSTLSDMHSYIAQRIISIFEVLAKRYIKLMDNQQQQQSDDFIVYEDLLILLMEMMNSTLTYRLKQNSQLVYALLQKREIFNPFQSNPRFIQLVQNVEEVITHFNTRLAEANLKAPSSNEVLRLIEQATRTWSNHKLILLPNLKFSYHQDPTTSSEFFIPCIWALIQKKYFIYWSENKSHILEAYKLINQEFDE